MVGTELRLYDLLNFNLDDSTAARVHVNLGRIYAMLGEALAREGRSLPEAMAGYQPGLQIGPNSREAHISLGEVCLRVGDRDGAIRAFQPALGLNPTAEDRQYLEAQLADLRHPNGAP